MLSVFNEPKITIVYFLLILLYSPCNINSQNLVRNHDFEQYSKCPYKYLSKKRFIKNWYSPTNGTPDYFNICSKGSASVPHNFAGKMFPVSGVGYVGAGLVNLGPGFSREYLATKLQKKLESGMVYAIEFHICLASNSKYCVGEIGVYLSNNKIVDKTDHELKMEPQLVTDFGFIRNSDSWERITFLYKAKGGEKYLIIGNFQDVFNLSYELISTVNEKEDMRNNDSYYYFDDISVRPAIKNNDTEFTIDTKKVLF